MPVAPVIVRRSVDIDFDSTPGPPWFPAGGPLEIMFNAASLSFPPTERFFIAAVRDYQHKVTAPDLRDRVRGFIHQEAMHNKVHLQSNAMLARHYPNCRRAEQISIATFRWLGRLPRSFRLSLSSALEHFTSMVADTLLRHQDDFRQIFPGAVADMWLWHAAEETEHKSVCLDVYRAALGAGPIAYGNRILGMLLATPLFLFVMLLLPAVILGRNRPTREEPAKSVEPSEPGGASKFLGRNMLGLLRVGVPWRIYFSYYRPSFHPSDHDNGHLISDWTQRHPGFGT